MSACSARAPRPELAKAEQAVLQAGESQAPAQAPLDLRIAREKLDKAKEAMNDEDYTEARRFAEAAEVDAQVAEAKANAAVAREEAGRIQEGLQTLQPEERNR